jgi:hypothetical protein
MAQLAPLLHIGIPHSFQVSFHSFCLVLDTKCLVSLNVICYGHIQPTMPLILCLFGASLKNYAWVGIPIPSLNDRRLIVPLTFSRFSLQPHFLLGLMTHRTSGDSTSSPQLNHYVMNEI